LWQVPPEAKGEYQVFVELNARPFATDSSKASQLQL
jgi:hypothetical protein